MNKLITKYLISSKSKEDEQSLQQSGTLVYIVLGLVTLALILLPTIDVLKEQIIIGTMAVICLVMLLFIKLGKTELAGVCLVTLLSIGFSTVIISRPVTEYTQPYRLLFDLYQLAFFQLFVLFITLIITRKNIHAAIVTTLAALTVIYHFLFMTAPNYAKYAPVPLADLLIPLFLILISGYIVIRSNLRGSALLNKINASREESEAKAVALNTIVLDLQNDFDTGQKLVNSAEELTGVTHSLRSIFKALQDEMKKLLSSSRKLGETGESVSQSSRDASQVSEDHSAVIEETSAAVTQMSSAIESISNIAGQRKENLVSLSRNAGTTEQALNLSSHSMIKLRELVSSLEGVNKVISSISAQTGLLAMNAAIEAAHAGEAGKGFAVVADEVRKLSDSASVNAKSIAGILKEISGSIEEAVGQNTLVTNAFLDFKEEINSVVIGIDEILSGISELAAGTSQINEGTTEALNATSRVKSGVAVVALGIKDIDREIEMQKTELQAVLLSIESALNEVDAVQKTGLEIREVGEVNAKNLESLAQRLKNSEGAA